MLLVLFLACSLGIIALSECSETAIDFLHNENLKMQFLQQGLFIAAVCISFCVRFPVWQGTENIFLLCLYNAITCWLLAFVIVVLISMCFVIPMIIKFLRPEQ